MRFKSANTDTDGGALERRLRVLFIVLLVIALAQVLWWMIDQTSLMNGIQRELETIVATEATVAQRLLDDGVSVDEVRALLPDLDVNERGGVDVAERLATISEMRREHLNQYRWEGAFFLVVLLGSLFVLWRAMRRAVELRRRQENFVAAVSHELKSPLASLRLALQTMQRRDLDGSRRRALTDQSIVDVDRLEGLVHNILETSRLDAGEVFSAREPVRPSRVLDHVIAGHGPAEQIGCDLVNDIDPALELHMDERALLIMLRNLLDNAVKAVHEADHPRVVASSERGGESVRIVIEDNGAGFEPSAAPRLFEKFYRPGDELRRKHSGTGLGLYLVARLAEASGGAVSAHSDGAGQGARFSLELPT